MTGLRQTTATIFYKSPMNIFDPKEKFVHEKLYIVKLNKSCQC